MKKHLFLMSRETGETVEVRSLMQSVNIDDHKLAIDALTGWIKRLEATTEAPENKNFYDNHHFYQRPKMRGAPFNSWRNLPENRIDLRRDVHQDLEAEFGWLARPLKSEILEQMNSVKPIKDFEVLTSWRAAIGEAG